VFKLLILSIVILQSSFGYSVSEPISKSKKIPIIVSIAPQAFFVSRIGGERVDVSVLIKNGQSPASFTPSSSQMEKISLAKMYFRIGVSFESAWLPKLKSVNTSLLVVDLGLKKQHDHDHDHDPHVWNDPVYVKKMSEVILSQLILVDPKGEKAYRDGYKRLVTDLTNLDLEIKKNLKGLPHNKFLVFHPAWHHFALRYGLVELAIEKHGKEPGPRELAEVIKEAKNLNIKTIFVQQQFDRRHALVVSRELGAKVITVDPLSINYLQNLRMFSLSLRKALTKNQVN